MRAVGKVSGHRAGRAGCGKRLVGGHFAGLERVFKFAGQRDLFFGSFAGFWRFLEGGIGGEARVVDLLSREKFFDAEDLDARIFVR